MIKQELLRYLVLKFETNARTFRYRSLLSEQNQNVLIWSAYYRNKNRTFQSVPKLFKIKSERFGVFQNSKTKPERNRANFLKRFHTPMLLSKQNGTFATYLQIVLLVRNVFFASSCSEIKTEILFFQKMISKRNQNVTNCVRVFYRQNKTFR